MFAKNTQYFRTKKGWRQIDLARKSGLNIGIITAVEQGRSKAPTIQTMMKIAKALDISLDVLVGMKRGRNRTR